MTSPNRVVLTELVLRRWNEETPYSAPASPENRVRGIPALVRCLDARTRVEKGLRNGIDVTRTHRRALASFSAHPVADRDRLSLPHAGFSHGRSKT